MSDRRLTIAEAIERLNELLEDVDDDAIKAMRQRMLDIGQEVVEVDVPEWGTTITMRPLRPGWNEGDELAAQSEAEADEAPTCDTCGAPATMVARHVFERFDPGESLRQFEPSKAHYYGCADHPVKSRTFEL